MKIYKALEQIKNLKPSQYSDEQLVGWLSALDGQIYNDLLKAYGVPAPELPYDTKMMGRELLVPAPDDEVYLSYLMAKIDLHNAEYERYNNNMMLFNAQLQAYYSAYTRTHLRTNAPVVKGVKAI